MTSPLVILLDFETYYDKEYSLSKMTTAEYVADKRFHVMMMAVKSRHETFNPVIAAGLSRTPDHTDTVSYLRQRGIPGETCAVLEGVSLQMYLDACKAWREKTREQIIVVGQNLAFDGLILSRHYDFEPDMYIDTMQLARYLGWHIAAGGASFAKLTAHLRAHGYNIPAKGEEVVRAMGKHRDDFEDYEWREYRNYCTDDVLITEELLNLAVRSLTETGVTAIGTNNAGDELAYQSLITAMAAAPRLMVDKVLAIEEHDGAVAKHKAALDKIRSYLAVASDDELKTILRSNDRLAQLLATLGGVAWYPNSANVQVIPEEDILPYGNFIIPQKISATTGKPTWAFGKKDRGFLALLGEDEEEQALAGVPHNIATVVQTIVQARLDVKSSIAETRAALFMRLADTGSLPVPYLIAGAHSSRMSGTGKFNCFTPGHELLTPDGWVKVEDYRRGTPIMQWHEDGTLSFDPAPGWLVKPYDGDVYDIRAPMVDCCVTPDHRFTTVSHAKAGGLRVITAETMYQRAHIDRIPVKGLITNADADITDAEIRYIVAFQADGTVVKGNAHTFGFRRPRKIARMTALLEELGWQYKKAEYKNKGKPWTHFRVWPQGVCSQYGKHFGAWLLQWSARQLNIFCDELEYWDGNRHSNGKTIEYNSQQQENALWVDTAMRLCGRYCSVYAYRYDARYSETWRAYERMSKYGAVVPARHMKKYYYHGLVYCPKVASDRILVRRNNKICVTNQCQNLPSGRDGQTNLLRRSIRAKRPEMKMIAVDSSQVEVRCASYLANNTADLTAFKEGRDIYCEAAARLYAEPYQVILEGAKKEHHPDYVRKRQVAKAAVLSCQFGTGARAFREYARVVGRVVLSEVEAQEIVRGYRNNNAPVVAAWQVCEDALMQMVQGYAGEFGAPFAYCKEGTTAQAYPLRFEGNRYVLGIPTPGIRLPSGYWINYRQLTAEPDQWPDGSPKTSYYFMQYKNGRVQKNYTYSSKIFENAVQGTAFQTMTWQAVRMNEELQLYTVAHDIAPDARPRIVMNTHDEWIAVAREQDAEAVLNLMLRWMRTAPPWLPGLPLDAEGSIADTYGDAK